MHHHERQWIINNPLGEYYALRPRPPNGLYKLDEWNDYEGTPWS